MLRPWREPRIAFEQQLRTQAPPGAVGYRLVLPMRPKDQGPTIIPSSTTPGAAHYWRIEPFERPIDFRLQDGHAYELIFVDAQGIVLRTQTTYTPALRYFLGPPDPGFVREHAEVEATLSLITDAALRARYVEHLAALHLKRVERRDEHRAKRHERKEQEARADQESKQWKQRQERMEQQISLFEKQAHQQTAPAAPPPPASPTPTWVAPLLAIGSPLMFGLGAWLWPMIRNGFPGMAEGKFQQLWQSLSKAVLEGQPSALASAVQRLGADTQPTQVVATPTPTTPTEPAMVKTPHLPREPGDVSPSMAPRTPQPVAVAIAPLCAPGPSDTADLPTAGQASESKPAAPTAGPTVSPGPTSNSSRLSLKLTPTDDQKLHWLCSKPGWEEVSMYEAGCLLEGSRLHSIAMETLRSLSPQEHEEIRELVGEEPIALALHVLYSRLPDSLEYPSKRVPLWESADPTLVKELDEITLSWDRMAVVHNEWNRMCEGVYGPPVPEGNSLSERELKRLRAVAHDPKKLMLLDQIANRNRAMLQA